MADYLLGYEATITLSGGSSPPAANVFQWGQSANRPLVDITSSGSLFRQYKASIQNGDGVFFDVMVDGSVASTTGAPIPSGTAVTFVGRMYSTTRYWSGTILVETVQLMNATMNGDVKQFLRYRCKWNSAITVAT